MIAPFRRKEPNNVTTFDALVSMSLLVLRQRGQWQGGATAYDDIDRAVNQCSDLLPAGSRTLCDMAVAELKRRCGIAAHTQNAGA